MQSMNQPSPADLRNVSPGDRVAVAHIAAGISWREGKIPGVHDAIVKMAYREQRDYAAVKRDVLCAAVALVLLRKEEPQPIRIGQHWANGSQEPVSPIALGVEDFTRWVEQETHKAAYALAVGTPYPDNEKGENEYKALIAHLNTEDRAWDSKYRPSQLTSSLKNIFTDRGGDDEEEEDAIDLYYDFGGEALYRAIEELSLPEKELIKALETGENLASVARRMGRTPAAVRQDARRVKEKIRRRRAQLADEIDDERDGYLEDDGRFERDTKAARDEAVALWDRNGRENPNFAWGFATLWMVRRGNIKRRIVQRFRDLSEMKSRSPSTERAKELTAEIKRTLDQIIVEARRDWIYENTCHIRRQRWEEAE